MALSIQSILSFLFIAFIALPLPIIMLAAPIHQLYKNWMRRKYFNTVNKFCERPFEMTEAQLNEIFPGIGPLIYLVGVPVAIAASFPVIPPRYDIELKLADLLCECQEQIPVCIPVMILDMLLLVSLWPKGLSYKTPLVVPGRQIVD